MWWIGWLNHLWINTLPSKDGEALAEMDRSINQSLTGQAADSECAVGMPWFAAYTAPRHEKRVAEMLAEREIESFLPLYKARRQWKKSAPVVLDLPLFPNYVFVRIEKQARGAVLSLPGVVSIVGSSKEPWPLSSVELEAFRAGLKTGKIEPHPYLTVGTKVRIKSGVMAGVEGILTRIKNEFRAVLSLSVIMKSVAVEVDSSNIEIIEAANMRQAV